MVELDTGPARDCRGDVIGRFALSPGAVVKMSTKFAFEPHKRLELKNAEESHD